MWFVCVCASRFNSLTPKSVLAGTKNSHVEGFWLAKHKNTNIPTHHDGAVFPSSGMVFMDEHTAPPGGREPLRKGLDEAAVKGEGF